MDKLEWPDEPEQSEEIAELWQEPWGVRRQEIVVIGQDLDQDAITQKFDACLLTEDELALGPEAWKQFNDPFLEWRTADEEELEPELAETLINA